MKNILNVASWDRIVRVVLGLGLLYVGFDVASGAWVWVSAAAGLILILTAALGFCPIYYLLKIRTLTGKLTGSR